MKLDDEVVGEAIRVEYSPEDDKLFLIFEITNPKYKQDVKKNWTQNVEFRLIERYLVKDE